MHFNGNLTNTNSIKDIILVRVSLNVDCKVNTKYSNDKMTKEQIINYKYNWRTANFYETSALWNIPRVSIYYLSNVFRGLYKIASEIGNITSTFK